MTPTPTCVKLSTLDGSASEPIPLRTIQTQLSQLHVSKSSSAMNAQTPISAPTVLHRPHHRTRPSILDTFADTNAAVNCSPICSKTQTSTAPSSLQTASASPIAVSTAKTSFVSDAASLRSTEERSRSNSALSTNAEIDTVPLDVSINTVERAAAVKTALEIFYNELLSAPTSARSLRRRDFEFRMLHEAEPVYHRLKARENFIAAESAHLRQTRVMKSKSVYRQSNKGLGVSGYEPVRVLGKGSFGVVRLVREKQDRSIDAKCTSSLKTRADSMPDHRLTM